MLGSSSRPEKWGQFMQVRAFIIAAAAVVSTIGVVHAADMAVKAPPISRTAPIAYTWTGCYVGVNAGGAWARSQGSMRFNDSAGTNRQAVEAAERFTLDPTGFTGGGQLGCNYQTGNFVLGAEGDLDYLGLRSSRLVTVPFPAGGGTFTVTDSMSTDWMATARGRIGYAVNNWLFYATGGLAVTQLRFNSTYADVFGVFENASLSDTRYGWTAGAGIEVAIGGGPWSAKLEYLHADFGTASVTGTFVPVGNTFGTHSVDLKTDIVRAGLNYRFGGGAPVVAKY
jgi:outer membrane immunogenic protein